jgi:hypothetical protein
MRFKIEQISLCEVRTYYFIDCDSHFDALKIASEIKTPTAHSGADYEIICDKKVIMTNVDEVAK